MLWQMVSYFVRNSVFRLLGNPLTDLETATPQVVGEEPTVASVENSTEGPSYLDVEPGTKEAEEEEEVYDEGVAEEDIVDNAAEEEEALLVSGLEEELDIVDVKAEAEDDSAAQYEEQHDFSAQLAVPSTLASPGAEALQPPSQLQHKSFADVVKRLAGDNKPAAPQNPPSNGRAASVKKEKYHAEESRDVSAAPGGNAGTGQSKQQVVALYVNQLGPDTTQNDITEVSRLSDGSDVTEGTCFIFPLCAGITIR